MHQSFLFLAKWPAPELCSYYSSKEGFQVHSEIKSSKLKVSISSSKEYWQVPDSKKEQLSEKMKKRKEKKKPLKK